MLQGSHSFVGSCLLGCALGLTASCASRSAGTAPPAPIPDLAPAVSAYADLVSRTYQEAHQAALVLQQSVAELIREPGPETLAAAQLAWVAARGPYSRSEAFRFCGGPIDIGDPAAGRLEGPEEEINGWPLDEAYIETVGGSLQPGIIDDVRFDIDELALRERNGLEDENAVLTGFHAIEFLLWGQDLDPAGPGRRSHEDFAGRAVKNLRRRMYLRVVTDLLVKDLGWLVRQWDRALSGSYASRFCALPPAEAVERMLTGVATLAGFELASERLSVPLESRLQEDEHSCFSDNTIRDLLDNVEGLVNVYQGPGAFPRTQGSVSSGAAPCLGSIAAAIDPELDRAISGNLDGTLAALRSLHSPFDRLLLAPPDDPERRQLAAAAALLQEVTGRFQELGTRLGLEIVVTAQ